MEEATIKNKKLYVKGSAGIGRVGSCMERTMIGQGICSRVDMGNSIREIVLINVIEK